MARWHTHTDTHTPCYVQKLESYFEHSHVVDKSGWWVGLQGVVVVWAFPFLHRVYRRLSSSWISKSTPQELSISWVVRELGFCRFFCQIGRDVEEDDGDCHRVLVSRGFLWPTQCASDSPASNPDPRAGHPFLPSAPVVYNCPKFLEALVEVL
jgi:hypothetical protein